MTDKQVHWLLHDLCVKLGFCLSPAAQAAIVKNHPASVTAFINAVYRAEGLDPRLQSDLYKLVYAHVAKAFQRAEATDS